MYKLKIKMIKKCDTKTRLELLARNYIPHESIMTVLEKYLEDLEYTDDIFGGHRTCQH